MFVPPRRVTGTFGRKSAPMSMGTKWANIVASLRELASTQIHRTAALGNVAGWREFVSIWMSVGPQVASFIPSDLVCPPGVDTFDDQLVWVWSVAGEYVDAAVTAVDSRSTLSTYMCWEAFEILQGHALIFPDGTVHNSIRERVEGTERLEDIVLQNRIARNTSGAIRARLRSMRDSLSIRKLERANKEE